MANELVLIETKIKEGDAALMAADKHTHKAVEMKIAGGKLYGEARDMCWKQGLDWTKECKRVTSRSMTQVNLVLRIANATDPYAEVKHQSEQQAERDKRFRENSNNERSATSTLQNKPVDRELTEWRAPPKPPTEPLPIAERPHVQEFLAAWHALHPDEQEYVLPQLQPMRF